MQFNRILVIRGGAIGDFILTLPALKALRDAYLRAEIEILGYKHIAVLADDRYYAQAVRSIEYGPLSSFFARNSELPGELADYFASFDLVVSYLYDPDRIFERNLRLCGVENLLCGPAKLDNSESAARQLARPLHQLGIEVADFAAKIFPSPVDREFAADFLGDIPRPLVAIHPGSGSQRKNWPIPKWIEFGNKLLSGSGGFSAGMAKPAGAMSPASSVVVVSGEADEDLVGRLEAAWKTERVIFAKNLPLPQLAAVLENTVFVGHDSGISHLAAAVGANCVLLFGPTDPEIWAPRNENVRIIRGPGGNMCAISGAEIATAVADTCSHRAAGGASS